VPLVFLPEPEVFFVWGNDVALPEFNLRPTEAEGASQSAKGAESQPELVLPEGRGQVLGRSLPVMELVPQLVTVPAVRIEALSGSVAIWILASKLALELLSRERVVPTIARRHGRIEARWAAALSASEDASRVAALARSMPPAAHAVPVREGTEFDVWAPETLLRAYLDAVVDGMLRTTMGGPSLPPARTTKRKGGEPAQRSWDERWRAALQGSDPAFQVGGFAERTVVEDLERWSAAAIGGRDRLRACFRLELPEADRDPFVLRFLLQSPDDPSLLVTAADVWKTEGRSLEQLGRAFRDPQESLLEALGRASRLFPAIEGALRTAKPETLELDAATAWTFLGEGATVLAEAGFGVIVPGELTASGQRRLRLRMRVGGRSKVAGAVAQAGGLGLEELLDVDWQAVIGDDVLTARELAALAKRKAPLVLHRGAWVAIDPRELADIQRRLSEGPSRMTVRDAVRAALAGETQDGPRSVSVAATGSLAVMLDRLRTGASSLDREPPSKLRATLRPYQTRGVAWLGTMGSLGLGACLADDMGLGKTLQLLAFLLRKVEDAPQDRRPNLIVAPTSVVGNWEREAARFAPSLPLVPHYGGARARQVEDFAAQAGALVVTTYGLLRRDLELLAEVEWSVVALDEAQNIKNAASSTARAARTLQANHRFALTGTPVENRLAELWSILEFANPGLLGPLTTFRREFAVPIERYGNDEAAARLRRIVSPFVLRREKSDPTIIPDLPRKHEMKVVCTLTREQATLYKAVVDEEMRQIERTEGIERRGRVLALLVFLKQICNHPAQYLAERGPLANRSGKLARITEMLEEALATGDKALVFTQFREMGDRLVAHFQASLQGEVAFLHGGTPQRARDELVRRFQDDPHGPSVFVLSVKAGGTGLNLTAANHVFHYDRWWNPAVEDQATDRAYRIGQRRAVQVHKLLSAGTVEEKVDRLLEHKRKLVAKVVGTGETWITELEDGELREFFALSSDAVVSSEDGDDERKPTSPRRERAKRTRRMEARS